MEEKISIKNEQETRWDMRAHGFNKSQKQSKQQLPQNVVAYLKAELPETQTVMDVGGGAGRYALLFSDYVKDILMTDISGNMLKYAKENADAVGKSNIRFKKVDFETVNDSEFLEEKFDLVFASMCPITRSNEGVDKMMKFSKGNCAIHQFILSKDSLLDSIQDETQNERKDPHNDRDSVLRIFSYLWQNGYNPQVKYFSEDNEEVLNTNELLERYKENPLVARMTGALKDQIKVTKNVKTALIYWNVNK